jgi:hypothetical protein
MKNYTIIFLLAALIGLVSCSSPSAPESSGGSNIISPKIERSATIVATHKMKFTNETDVYVYDSEGLVGVLLVGYKALSYTYSDTFKVVAESKITARWGRNDSGMVKVETIAPKAGELLDWEIIF